jgi:hypothetical protein
MLVAAPSISTLAGEQAADIANHRCRTMDAIPRLR